MNINKWYKSHKEKLIMGIYTGCFMLILCWIVVLLTSILMIFIGVDTYYYNFGNMFKESLSTTILIAIISFIIGYNQNTDECKQAMMKE